VRLIFIHSENASRNITDETFWLILLFEE